MKVLFTSGFPDIHDGERPHTGVLLRKPYRGYELAQMLHDVLQRAES
jgi:hypothetical protein